VWAPISRPRCSCPADEIAMAWEYQQRDCGKKRRAVLLPRPTKSARDPHVGNSIDGVTGGAARARRSRRSAKPPKHRGWSRRGGLVVPSYGAQFPAGRRSVPDKPLPITRFRGRKRPRIPRRSWSAWPLCSVKDRRHAAEAPLRSPSFRRSE